METKSFKEWEAEQQTKGALQGELEAEVLTALHMMVLEVGRRFKMDSAKVPPNTVRLCRANGNSLDITSKTGVNFDLLRHSPAEFIGKDLSIDEAYEKIQKFATE